MIAGRSVMHAHVSTHLTALPEHIKEERIGWYESRKKLRRRTVPVYTVTTLCLLAHEFQAVRHALLRAHLFC
jgi:hypothetical protein